MTRKELKPTEHPEHKNPAQECKSVAQDSEFVEGDGLEVRDDSQNCETCSG